MFWIALVVCAVGLIISINHYNTIGVVATTILITIIMVFACLIVDCMQLDSKNIDYKTVYETNINNLDCSISANGEIENYVVTYEDGNTKTIEPSKDTTIIFENVNKNSRNSNLEGYKHIKVSKKEVFSFSTFTTVTLTQYIFS